MLPAKPRVMFWCKDPEDVQQEGGTAAGLADAADPACTPIPGGGRAKFAGKVFAVLRRV
jgi:hypothetical protein